MIHAIVISNGLGSGAYYRSSEEVTYHIEEITPDFDPDLTPYDLLIVPNGCDHIAMLRIRRKVRAFLEAGRALLCCDGWFTDWVPGNRWLHDNSQATREVRHFAGADRHGLLEGVDLTRFDHEPHGMSGWWACGYIEAAPGADVLIADTWERPLVVVDERTTAGLMLLTASGPLGDFSYSGEGGPIACLYRNILRLVIQRSIA